MNKLGFFALLLLLVLGGALWGLANLSLNAHLKMKIESIGSNISGKNVTVETVDISPSKGTGKISHLVISDKSTANDTPILTIASIELTIDPKSLQEKPIIINELIIHQPEITLLENEQTINELLKNISKHRANYLAENEKAEKQKEPYIQINTIKVLAAKIKFKNINQPENTEIRHIKQYNLNNNGSDKEMTVTLVASQALAELLTSLVNYQDNFQ